MEDDGKYGIQRCMTAPKPSTYVAVAAAPSKKPARHFCNVCGYFGMYVFATVTWNSLHYGNDRSPHFSQIHLHAVWFAILFF